MNAKFNHIIAIDEWNKGEYAGFEARELWRSESGNGWNWQKYNDNPRKWTPPTQGIKLYSQCNKNGQPMYALDVKQAEEMTMRNIEQAEANLKRLKAINKKFEELCEKFGRPATFATFAAYIAEATGAKLAMYNRVIGDYSEVTISDIEYKERRLTCPNE
jgi:hypothetical protein